MNRRKFLLGMSMLGMSGLTFGSNLMGVKNLEDLGNKKIVIILLRGGADGLSMLVPYGDSNYEKHRPNISVSEKEVLKLNEHYGFHPALKSYMSAYEKNEIILIPNAGQLDNSRSHFQAQSVMEFGVNKNTSVDGFLNRLVQVTNNNNPFSFTNGITDIFKGDRTIKSLRLKEYYTNIGNNEFSQIANSYKQEEKLYDNFNQIINTNNTINKLVYLDPGFQKKRFGEKIGIMMREEQINIGFIDFNGWDTHAKQGTLNGKFHELAGELNETIVDLKENIKDEWKNTVVVVMSEFGRTIRENGGYGTDHGHGNLLTIMGGMVHQSKIMGINNLNIASAHEERDLNVDYDYREILGNILLNNCNFKKESIDFVFPGLKFEIKNPIV